MISTTIYVPRDMVEIIQINLSHTSVVTSVYMPLSSSPECGPTYSYVMQIELLNSNKATSCANWKGSMLSFNHEL